MVSNDRRLSLALCGIALPRELMPKAQCVGERVLHRVRAIFCGLLGHEDLLQFQRDRMFLRCLSCGHESSGWELNRTPPTVTPP